jgi:hypothetical protein
MHSCRLYSSGPSGCSWLAAGDLVSSVDCSNACFSDCIGMLTLSTAMTLLSVHDSFCDD